MKLLASPGRVLSRRSLTTGVPIAFSKRLPSERILCQQWVVHQALEIHEEAKRLHLAHFLHDLYEVGSTDCHMDETEAPALDPEAIQAISVVVEPEALQLDMEKLSAAGLHAMLQHFMQGGRLHTATLLTILQEAAQLLGEAPSVSRVACPPQGHVTIVGDLHGSLGDLMQVLEYTGMPGGHNVLIFNGDFIDRGQSGVEVLAVLLTLKLLYPDFVYLNRGNHEDSQLAKVYDFHAEVTRKYPDAANAVYDAASVVFAHLPVCAVIPGQAFVVHAGLPGDQDLTLADIEALERTYTIRTVCRKGQVKGAKLIEDLVWSDPDPVQNGTKRNKARNAGCLYGRDVVRSWLKALDLKYLVRSHQCVQQGFQELDCGEGYKVFTVFSVSNYPNKRGTNRGAILRFNGDGSMPMVIQYSTDEVSELDLLRHNQRSLSQLVMGHKELLWQGFKAKAEGEPHISPEDWVAVMETEICAGKYYYRPHPNGVTLRVMLGIRPP